MNAPTGTATDARTGSAPNARASAAPGTRSTRLRSTRLRVASFNIRNGWAWDGRDSWWFRRRTTASVVKQLDADVVALQEAYLFQQRFLQRRLRHYGAAGVGCRDGHRRGGHNSVLYRPPLLLERQVTRWFSSTPDVPGSLAWESRVPRTVTFAHLREPHSGRRFGFANLHWEGASQRSRDLSAEALLDWLEPGLPWIVAGDFNASPGDRAIGRLRAAGLRDTCLEALAKPEGDPAGEEAGDLAGHPAADSPSSLIDSLDLGSRVNLEPEPAAGPGPTQVKGTRRIDYIFVTHEWHVRAASVRRDPAGRRASDHWPVVAELVLG